MADFSDSGEGFEDHTSRWHRRRTEIVDVAAELFASKGYAATGVSDLGESVGLGRGALYYYIGSKEQLLSLIHDRVMREVLASADQVRELDVDPLEQLRLLGIELIRIITTFPAHVWVFLHEYQALTGTRAADFRAKREQYEESVAAILRDGAQLGLFDVSDLDLTVLAWLGMHNYTYMWYRSGGRASPLKIATTYHTIFTEGLLTEEARRRTRAHLTTS